MKKLLCASSLFALVLTWNGPGARAQSAVRDLKAKAERIISPITGTKDDRLQEVAKFDHQVTGVTVSEDGRIFVNFPRWSEDVAVSVAEVMKDGSIKAYPNDEWNAWRNLNMASVTPNGSGRHRRRRSR